MKAWKLISSISVTGIFLITVSLSVHAQQDIRTVEDSGFSGKQKMRQEVFFDHDAHNEQANLYDCNICHHEDSVGMECSECHLSGPDASPMELIRAYHLQCRSCHLEEKSGPVLCGECHNGAPQ